MIAPLGVGHRSDAPRGSRIARATSGGPQHETHRALRVAFSLIAGLAALPSGGCLEPDGTPNGAPSSEERGPPVAAPSAPATAPADPLLQRLAQKPLRYTRHGRCRMACRHISEAEVRALLSDGHVVPERTRSDGECTSYAVEGRTSDAQDVRIVYADCARETRVVTTIDLGHDWPCHCD